VWNTAISTIGPVQVRAGSMARGTVPAAAVPAASPTCAASASAKRLRIALGTLVAVEATGNCAAAAEAAVEAAFAAITRIARRMHPRSADGDLARINNAPPLTPVPVHASTCGLLNLARLLNLRTQGVFDPCLPCRPGRVSDIEISPDQVVLCHAPVALDFGGFAKGYAVDCAIAALRAHGCTAGLVNAGGDLRVFGPRTEPVLLRGPAGELTEVALLDAALAVSDMDSQRRPAEHQGYYIRHREHGEGSSRQAPGAPPMPRHAAVIANEAAIADALTKCMLLCARPTARGLLQAFGATQAA
jgi:FAD:protein FMN transferase